MSISLQTFLLISFIYYEIQALYMEKVEGGRYIQCIQINRHPSVGGTLLFQAYH